MANDNNTLYGFAEALSNENFAIANTESTVGGGHGGDQAGGELAIRQWYQHDAKWAKIYRVKDTEIGEKMARFMEDAILNGWVGYSQGNYSEVDRNSFHRQLRTVGYDPNRVSAPCAVDCSSLVFTALRHALGDGFKVVSDSAGDVPTMTIDGVTYCTDYHKCDRFHRSNTWLPTGHNFDWIFERVLPLMGYEVDVYTMLNKGLKWQYTWPTLSTGIRYMEIAELDDPEELTPKVRFGDKAFRVKKDGDSYVIDTRGGPVEGAVNYRTLSLQGRLCHTPYDIIRPTLKGSIQAFNTMYLGQSDYIDYAVNTKCSTPFDAYIDPDSGQEVNKLVPISGATVTDPNGITGRQVYMLCHDTDLTTPINDETLDGNPPIYCAFFDQDTTTYNGLPLLGVSMDNAQLAKLNENLHVHIHGQADDDFPDGFDLYDYVVNGNALKRGDVVRTRGYSNLALKYRYPDDSGESGSGSEDADATAEPYLTSPGHIAIWV